MDRLKNDIISIVVPVYNAERYLRRCLNSIINQSYDNLEIILVNDGSTDNSLIICNEYAKKDQRIQVLNISNSGSSVARNKGLDMVKGKYLSFVDADDYLYLDMYKILMQYMHDNDLDFIEIEPHDQVKNFQYDGLFSVESPIECTKRILRRTSFAVWRRLYRTSLIEDMRFIPGIIHQDVFYTMDLLKRSTRNGYLNKPLYFYNTDSIGIIRGKYSLNKIETAIKATEYIINNVIDNKLLKKDIDQYVLYYYTDHFYLLNKNSTVDPNRLFRKKLKKIIKEKINISNLKLRFLVVLMVPIFLIEKLFSIFNKNNN
ncbi:glycosyltransferase [Winogradskyella sp. A2]|uniref:glycosyltransferase n=1 Tax=Winogradskyella sp. A2 TaxID=3366944 RepID=UPI00398C5E2D